MIVNINLRLIKQDDIKDRENYFALQKSVALFPDRRLNFEKDLEDKFWQDQFEKNRVCYVIETIPECLYCGECAVKDITADIPEVEIELMQEYQHQGIGYKAMLMMFDQLAKKYGKQELELISNLARKHKMSPKQISESLGVTVQKVKRRLNTYYVLEIFKNDPDCGEYFIPNKFSSIFYEIMGKPEIREGWLEWL